MQDTRACRLGVGDAVDALDARGPPGKGAGLGALAGEVLAVAFDLSLIHI